MGAQCSKKSNKSSGLLHPSKRHLFLCMVSDAQEVVGVVGDEGEGEGEDVDVDEGAGDV